MVTKWNMNALMIIAFCFIRAKIYGAKALIASTNKYGSADAAIKAF
jgi:hypothetical protein